jgi:hypothetical protein
LYEGWQESNPLNTSIVLIGVLKERGLKKDTKNWIEWMEWSFQFEWLEEGGLESRTGSGKIEWNEWKKTRKEGGKEGKGKKERLGNRENP